MQCCTVVQATCEKQQTPQFRMEWKGWGRGVDFLFSEVTLFEYNVSTILFADCSLFAGALEVQHIFTVYHV